MPPTEVAVSSIPSPSSLVSSISSPYAAYRNRGSIFEITHHTPNSDIVHPTQKDPSPITQPPFSNSKTGNKQSTTSTREEEVHQHSIEGRGSNILHENTDYNGSSITPNEYRPAPTTPREEPNHSRPRSAPPRQQYKTPNADLKDPASPLTALRISTETGGGVPETIDDPSRNLQHDTISCKIRRQNPDRKRESLRQGRRIRHIYVNATQKGKYY